MCGIDGYLDKRGGTDRPIGRVLLNMLQALSCRGPDSAGVALFGPATAGHLRLSVPPGSSAEVVGHHLQQLGGAVVRQYGNGVFDATLAPQTNSSQVEEQIR